MQDDPFDADKTMVFRRPAFAGAGAAGASMAQAPNAAPVEIRQIGTLGAINPLVAAANPLLITLPSLRTAGVPGDIASLRARLIEMVRDFDNACVASAVADDQRHLARYALCTVLDEAIQRTPWGGTANWAQQSLLIHFFKENWGGEKFFQILDKLMQTPARYAALLELYYVCLALGFMGRYLLTDAAGRQAVAELRERLHQLIRQSRPESDRALSQRWQGLSVESRKFKGFMAFWLAVAFAVLAGLGLYAFLAFTLLDSRQDLGLEQLALKPTPPARTALAPAAKPRLAQLLAAEIQAGQLQVRDLQHESVVTLLGETTFDSGSATPARGAAALIDKVAQALDQVEGRVIVTGHTDNVPTRTLRFPSNFELSKERARSVAALVGARIRDASRLSSEGRGDTEPVAPNNTAEGRAQNRRVEITLRVAAAGQ
jgi:type VI secretion system protein ImpK